jgi:hypothetical protein
MRRGAAAADAIVVAVDVDHRKLAKAREEGEKSVKSCTT